jgi:hypothetical protein
VKKGLGGLGWLGVLTLGLLLSGCTSQETLNQISPSDLSQQNSNLTPLGIVSRIRPGQTISGYLDDKGKEGWGDSDWYLLEGASSGTEIRVTLSSSSSAVFGLGVRKDGAWAKWTWGSATIEIKTITGTTTWIWVGAWTGKGNYTLSVSGRIIIDEREVNCLAIVLMSEASIGTTAERTAVAWTVFNRVSSPRFPNTICEVAFSGAYATNQNPTQDIINLARNLIQNRGTDPTGGATHFFSPISMPKEGEEYLCRLPVGRGNMDCNGGLREVPGITKRVYFPSWRLCRNPLLKEV